MHLLLRVSRWLDGLFKWMEMTAETPAVPDGALAACYWYWSLTCSVDLNVNAALMCWSRFSIVWGEHMMYEVSQRSCAVLSHANVL